MASVAARPAGDREGPPTEEQLLESFEAERPGRKLGGAPAKLVAVVGAALSCSRSPGS